MFATHRLPAAFALLAPFAFAAVAPAQFELRGQIEFNQAATCYYCPPITNWVIHGTETALTSSSVNFANYAGLEVVMTGSWTSSGGLPLFDVATIQTTSLSFQLSGNSSIGNTIRFEAFGANGDLAINLASLGAGATPLSSTTTLLLAPATTVVLGFDVISAGRVRTDFDIPSIPSLVGLHIFGQALILPASATPFFFTEPDAKRIQ